MKQEKDHENLKIRKKCRRTGRKLPMISLIFASFVPSGVRDYPISLLRIDESITALISRIEMSTLRKPDTY
jgi:hypothetical protein